MNGNSDESEKKLLKEFCNVSLIITRETNITDIFYSRSRTKGKDVDFFFLLSISYKNIFLAMNISHLKDVLSRERSTYFFFFLAHLEISRRSIKTEE
jgi:hypothetical protein